jgi:hypothetical protein
MSRMETTSDVLALAHPGTMMTGERIGIFLSCGGHSVVGFESWPPTVGGVELAEQIARKSVEVKAGHVLVVQKTTGTIENPSSKFVEATNSTIRLVFERVKRDDGDLMEWIVAGDTDFMSFRTGTKGKLPKEATAEPN